MALNMDDLLVHNRQFLQLAFASPLKKHGNEATVLAMPYEGSKLPRLM